MDNKKLISLTLYWILVIVSGLCVVSFGNIESGINTEAEQHIEKANELRKITDYDAAITEYNKVISLSPDSRIAQDAQYWIGQSYFEMMQYDSALSAFQKLLEEYPEGAIIPSTKLMIERVQQEKMDRALFEAARNGELEQVKLLISQGANVNMAGPSGRTPLSFAIQNNHKDIVELLVDNGAKLYVDDTSYYFALQAAARSGSRDLVELFLSKGIDTSSIHMAACAGDLSKVQEFIEQGTEVDTEDEAGWTPLNWAISSDQTEVAKFLIDNGADINTTGLLHQAAVSNAVEVAELLISKGASVDVTNNVGFTPLHLARHRDIAELLIAKGADINAKNNNGYTPLYIAATYNPEVAELLIENDADVNARGSLGDTPLFAAAANGHKEIVELLISKGADTNIPMDLGTTPLDVAEQNGHAEIVELLREHGAETQPLHEAVVNGDIEKVKQLISEGADVNAGTLLHLACANSRKEVAELLIENGIDVNTKDDRGMTPLDFALRFGSMATLQFLIENGADVNTKDDRGMTPLHYATRSYIGAVGLLIENGADVNAKDSSGQSPKDLAEGIGRTEVVELLLEHGAEPSEAGAAPRGGARGGMRRGVRGGLRGGG